MLKIVLVMAAVLFSLSAQAATWYRFTSAVGKHTLFFFDRDSVIKRGDRVTVWILAVEEDKHPAPDGSYSTATRYVYSCKERTAQHLAEVAYRKDGQVLQSVTQPDAASDVVPGTVNEDIYNTVCSHNFPRDKKNVLYLPVEGNNTAAATNNYFAEQEALLADVAPLGSVWYILANSDGEKYLRFIDSKSIKKNGNEVTAWVLLIFNPNAPGAEDGIYSLGTWTRYSCTKRTMKSLRGSRYDSEGKFQISVREDDTEYKIADGSVAGAELKAFCSGDFPSIEGSVLYVPLKENRPFDYAKELFESLKASKQ